MAVHLVCLTAGGGVPLFTRMKGHVKPLAFPVVGSLNGVHMFAGNHNVEILSTEADGCKVASKVFHNSISLLLVSWDDSVTDADLSRQLEYIFQAMVLVYGLDDLINIKNVERFKREINVCFRVLDSLLDSGDHVSLFSTLTGALDVLMAPENSILQNYLDAFTEAAKSQYGCLLVMGKVTVATPKWWQLTPTEQILLSILINCSTKCSSRDVPVFLPHSSPRVPHRLTTFQLVHGIEVCVLCGPTPTLSQLEQEVRRFWQSAYDSLKALIRVHPRNLPYAITLDINILGLLLINIETYRCLSTVRPTDHEDSSKIDKSLTRSRRTEILQAFYKSTTLGVFPMLQSPAATTDELSEVPADSSIFTHNTLDTYLCCRTHKCYAYRYNQYQLFLILAPAVPTYAMRSIASKTVNSILKEKFMKL